MVQTTAMLLKELQHYASPADKLSRMVRQGIYTPIVKGLYETDSTTNAYLLSGCIYGPSYLSFEFALSKYGFIPEGVRACTSATFEKRKKKSYQTPFGAFLYQDVPSAVYPYGVKLVHEGDYTYLIATPEKAVCDQLYKMSPVRNYEELTQLLFEDLRMERSALETLNENDIAFLSQKYKCTNVSKLDRWLRRKNNAGDERLNGIGVQLRLI